MSKVDSGAVHASPNRLQLALPSPAVSSPLPPSGFPRAGRPDPITAGSGRDLTAPDSAVAHPGRLRPPRGEQMYVFPLVEVPVHCEREPRAEVRLCAGG